MAAGGKILAGASLLSVHFFGRFLENWDFLFIFA